MGSCAAHNNSVVLKKKQFWAHKTVSIGCFCFDTDDNNDEVGGRTFTLDDVFNDTFNPKLFHAQWISGMLSAN